MENISSLWFDAILLNLFGKDFREMFTTAPSKGSVGVTIASPSIILV